VLLDQASHPRLVASTWVKIGVQGEIHLHGGLQPVVNWTLDQEQKDEQHDEEKA
jgi:hypothetical protein